MYNFCTEQEFLKRLETYVMHETPSGNYEQMQAFNAMLEQDLIAAGADVIRFPGKNGDILAAKVGDGPRCALLLGHKDTVFPLGTAAQNPFRIEEKDGNPILRGPGVFDMKAGVCMSIEMLRHFAQNPQEGWSIVALFNCDEEIGSPDSCDIICELLKKANFCLCMEPANPGQCVVARKGISSFFITAHGIAAHSGVNYAAGASAIEALCRLLTKVYDLRDDAKGLSINIGSLTAPGARNIVADFAEAQGEFRCFDPSRIEAALEALKKLCANSPVDRVHFDLKILPGRPPLVQDEASKKLFDIACDCAKAHGMPLKGDVRGGGSDAAYASALHVPVLDGMSAEGAGPHTPNEYVRLDTLSKRLKFCADTLTQAITSKYFD